MFTDDEYRAAGLEVSDAALDADVLIAVKEIPSELFRPGGAYLFFSHTIKGQPYNMPMLRRLLDLGCTLLDYERIVDADGRRLIFFSIHAGYAGMIESLRALGLRLRSRGRETALADVKPAYEYGDLDAARVHLTDIGERLKAEHAGEPLVIGVSGYGNVSRGAQEVLDWLPVTEVSVDDLPRAAEVAGEAPLAKVVFGEVDMVRPAGDHAFELQDYFANPGRYEGRFADHLPHLDMLVNTIFWTEDYPRLVTRAWAEAAFADGSSSRGSSRASTSRAWAEAAFADGAEPRLQVVGDISIDIEGSIELSVKATYPDAPCFTVDPVDGTVRDGVEGRGITIMAVDNLPCELPRESSEHFSEVLKDMVAPLGDCDWTAPFADLDLPPHLKTAVIAHAGELAPDYAYLSAALAAAEEA